MKPKFIKFILKSVIAVSALTTSFGKLQSTVQILTTGILGHGVRSLNEYFRKS